MFDLLDRNNERFNSEVKVMKMKETIQTTVVLTKGKKESWGHTFVRGEKDKFEANGKFITTGSVMFSANGTSLPCLIELDVNNNIADWALWEDLNEFKEHDHVQGEEIGGHSITKNEQVMWLSNSPTEEDLAKGFCEVHGLTMRQFASAEFAADFHRMEEQSIFVKV